MKYSTIAPGYNELYREEQLNKLNIIKKHIEVKPEHKLLDIGCGTGISTNYFKCNSKGIDPCQEMIEQGENLTLGEAEQIPFQDNEFDIILSITAVHHFKDLDKAIEEIKRVSKPEAKIIITIMKKAKSFRKIRETLNKHFKFKEYDEEKDLILIS